MEGITSAAMTVAELISGDHMPVGANVAYIGINQTLNVCGDYIIKGRYTHICKVVVA